jgi:hypothetical protein
MRVERVGEVVGQGICGGDGAGHPAGGYCASMGDDWRVRIAFDEDDPPELPESGEQALVAALRSRLSDQVAVTSNGTEIFLYAPAAGSADEAAQVAREVLARHDVSALVRTECWSPWEEEWLDVTDKPSADVAAEQQAEQQAEHEYRQEQERERSRRAGFPAWQVRVEVPSHRDVVALAGHLAAQGWRVRRRRRHLLVGADCEDDAKGLVRELSGDGRADADTAFRVGRVSYSYMLFDARSTQVTGGGGPLVRNFSSPSQQTRRSSRHTIGYAPILS